MACEAEKLRVCLPARVEFNPPRGTLAICAADSPLDSRSTIRNR
jgi:hypothetical protein